MNIKKEEVINKKFRVGFVGAGNIAREHIKAYRDIEGVEICGITSRTAEKARKMSDEFGPFPVFESIGELHEETHADLVVVCVSVPSLRQAGIECLSFPWAVFLEKPIGINYSESLELFEAAKRTNSKVIVGLNRRFYSNLRAQKEALLKEPEEKMFIHVYDQQDENKALELGHPKEVVDNWMYANSIHLIDFFRFFGRRPIQTVRPLIWDKGKSGERGIIVSEIEYCNGDIGIYEGAWNMPGPWAVVVHSKNYRWETRPLEKTIVKSATDNTETLLETSGWDKEFKPGFRLQAQEAISFLRGERSDAIMLDEGVESMRLVRSIYANEPVDYLKQADQP